MRLLWLIACLLLVGCVAIPGVGGQKQTTSPSGTTQPPAGTTGSQATEPAANVTQPSSGATQPSSGTSAPQTTTPPASATSLKSKEISFYSGAWLIYGTLYESQSKTPNRAIILVPMLGKTRDSYPISLIESLHNQVPDAVVVALDMRGHGKSTNLGTWNDFGTYDYMDMKTDILSVKKALEPSYPNIDSYQVIGASVGSTAAILAGAQDRSIDKIVMLSPGMEYKGVDITRAADDYQHPLLVIASSSDRYSADSVSEIKSLRLSSQTESKIYPGTAHGTDIFAATEGDMEPASGLIVDFVK